MSDPAPSSRQRRLAERRLPSALAGLLAIVLVTTGLGWAFLGLSLRSLESVFHDRVEVLAFLHTMNDEMQHRLADMAIKAERGVVPMDSAAASVRVARERAQAAWDAYLLTWFTPAEADLVERITPTIEAGFGLATRLADTLAAGERTHVAAFLDGVFFTELDAFSDALRELVALQVRVTQDAYELSRARFGIAKQAFIGTVVAACVLVLVGLLASSRRTNMPIRRWTR